MKNIRTAIIAIAISCLGWGAAAQAPAAAAGGSSAVDQECAGNLNGQYNACVSCLEAARHADSLAAGYEGNANQTTAGTNSQTAGTVAGNDGTQSALANVSTLSNGAQRHTFAAGQSTNCAAASAKASADYKAMINGRCDLLKGDFLKLVQDQGSADARTTRCQSDAGVSSSLAGTSATNAAGQTAATSGAAGGGGSGMGNGLLWGIGGLAVGGIGGYLWGKNSGDGSSTTTTPATGNCLSTQIYQNGQCVTDTTTPTGTTTPTNTLTLSCPSGYQAVNSQCVAIGNGTSTTTGGVPLNGTTTTTTSNGTTLPTAGAGNTIVPANGTITGAASDTTGTQTTTPANGTITNASSDGSPGTTVTPVGNHSAAATGASAINGGTGSLGASYSSLGGGGSGNGGLVTGQAAPEAPAVTDSMYVSTSGNGSQIDTYNASGTQAGSRRNAVVQNAGAANCANATDANRVQCLLAVTTQANAAAAVAQTRRNAGPRPASTNTTPAPGH